jgi:hypothetical protein
VTLEHRLLGAIVIGLGATLLIDLWALLLRRGFGIPSLNLCLLGRWILHMPGTIVHRSIAAASPRRLECPFGWLAHYSIGTMLALSFVALSSASWLEQPTLFPAVVFGVATTVMPFFVMQPALGFGIASSKTPKPGQARLKSLATHTVFGVGLYLSALLLRQA